MNKPKLLTAKQWKIEKNMLSSRCVYASIDKTKAIHSVETVKIRKVVEPIQNS